MFPRISCLVILFAAGGGATAAAEDQALPARAAEEMDERLARTVRDPSVKVTPAERPPPKFATPVVTREAVAPAVPRPATLLDPDLTSLLTDTFRFNRGARITAGFAGQKVVVARNLGASDETNAILFARLIEVLENEDAELHRFIADSDGGFSLEAFSRGVAFTPTLKIVLLGSRPLVAEFDFHARRAIVTFDGRWGSRALPRLALVTLLPGIGSEIYSFLEAEAEAGRGER